MALTSLTITSVSAERLVVNSHLPKDADLIRDKLLITLKDVANPIFHYSLA